jgi:NTP pyrophosphatase (non-canonical NTP hydrolase)
MQLLHLLRVSQVFVPHDVTNRTDNRSPIALQYIGFVVSEALLQQLKKFVAERNWEQFHSPENLAKSISIEAAELLEAFQWNSDADEKKVREELADVLTYCILLADKYNLDIEEIVLDKLQETQKKYPVEKSFGKSDKYDRL